MPCSILCILISLHIAPLPFQPWKSVWHARRSKWSESINSNIPSPPHNIIPPCVHSFNPENSLPSALRTKDLSMVYVTINLNSIQYAHRLTISHLKKRVCFGCSPCPSCIYIYRTDDLSMWRRVMFCMHPPNIWSASAK